LKEWLDSINIKIPSITIKTAILGDNLQSKAMNHIILITKYYIYLSKINQSKSIFKNLLLAIKHKIKIEKFSSTKNGVKIFLTFLGCRVSIAPAPCTAPVKKSVKIYI
jgi:hypothetical protein